MKRVLSIIMVLVVTVSFFVSAAAGMDLPKKKTTKLGLYVSAAQAYEKWRSDPQNVVILDVRTPQEYIYVGHAPMALNIPIKFVQEGEYTLKMKPKMTINKDFVTQVQSKCKKDATILIMCRSGARSAVSANLLTDAGFTNVYNIFDGFEGDKMKAPGTEKNGKRLVNGWKNAGAPWTYKLDKELAYIQ